MILKSFIFESFSKYEYEIPLPLENKLCNRNLITNRECFHLCFTGETIISLGTTVRS
jgi:hypothetical protein